MVVGKIVDEGDRVLLYPQSEDAQISRDVGCGKAKMPANVLGGYHIIASREQVADLKEGDIVEYEPFGFNFGWFSKKATV